MYICIYVYIYLSIYVYICIYICICIYVTCACFAQYPTCRSAVHLLSGRALVERPLSGRALVERPACLLMDLQCSGNLVCSPFSKTRFSNDNSLG